MRIDLGPREVPRERLDLPLVLREVEVHCAGDDTCPLFAGSPARAVGPS
jgi:hypothetical protein